MWPTLERAGVPLLARKSEHCKAHRVLRRPMPIPDENLFYLESE
jgi:hypothetical protein